MAQSKSLSMYHGQASRYISAPFGWNGRLMRTSLLRTALYFLLLFCTHFLGGCSPDVWEPGKALEKNRITVAVLYIDKAESGYSLAHETGIMQMQAETGLKDSQILRKYNVTETDSLLVEHAIRESIAAGANIVIATSWGYMDACEKLAKEYPNTVFAHASGYKSNNRNFTNYFGRIYQARYLSGLVAGLQTRSGKIGYVAAMGVGNSEVTSGINAFALGVEKVNPDAGIYVRVTNSWYDPQAERKEAQRLLAQGCDVIAQHCNTLEPQLAAQERGVWSIGYNTDMRPDAPKAVLTSAVWNWGAYYTHLIRSVISGTFTPEPYYGGIKEGMVGLSPLHPDLATPAMEAAVKEASEAMRAGKLFVFTGPLQTADGRLIGEVGKVLPDAEVSTAMNWYYRTVTMGDYN